MSYISALFHNLKYLLIGAGATSLAEYLFSYNLVDFLLELLKKAVGYKKTS